MGLTVFYSGQGFTSSLCKSMRFVLPLIQYPGFHHPHSYSYLPHTMQVSDNQLCWVPWSCLQPVLQKYDPLCHGSTAGSCALNRFVIADGNKMENVGTQNPYSGLKQWNYTFISELIYQQLCAAATQRYSTFGFLTLCWIWLLFFHWILFLFTDWTKKTYKEGDSKYTNWQKHFLLDFQTFEIL